ncbi:MAG: rare lipoprotein [Candidatus Binatota bacterium]|nr:rare lipoprotein [Candidatus Binatota bacterium]
MGSSKGSIEKLACVALGAALLALSACAAGPAPSPVPLPSRTVMRLLPDAAPAAPARAVAEIGPASWYGGRFHGRATANGERFDRRKLTAAHPSLPLGSRVRVTNLANGESVDVRINDRGPFIDGRIIDLSYRAARTIGIVEYGVVTVAVEPIDSSVAVAGDPMPASGF